MNLRIALLALAALAIPSSAIAGAFNSSHPEEGYPDDIAPLASPDGPYDDFIKQVQQSLHAAGFDAGPVNGDFGIKTQAALAQYQLSQLLPASGALDDKTLAALGVERPAVPD
jgi:peptidoglycan hydrolase-like protein with peptidoglycan-binding domain